MKAYKTNGLEISKEEIERLYALTQEPEKKYGELMVGSGGMTVTFRSENNGFGLTKYGAWRDLKDWTPMYNNNWKPATPEQKDQYCEMLIEHAKNKGYKPGNYKCLDRPDSTVGVGAAGSFTIENGGVWYSTEHSGDKVFDGLTGEWADIIEPKKLTHSEITKLIGKEFEYVSE